MGKMDDLEPPVPPEEIAAAELELAAEKPKDGPEAKADDPKKEEKQEEKPEKKHKYTDEEGNPLVRLDALHEARQQLKQTRADMQRLAQEQAQRQALLDQRLQMLYQAQNPPPDESVDPVGAMRYKQEMTDRQLAEFRQRQQFEDMQRQQHDQVNQLVGWAQSEAAQFAADKPDFKDAYEFVKQKRAAELRALGLEGQALAQTMVQDELWVFQNAAQTGRNPGEVIYAMAKAIGFGGNKQGTVTAEKKMEVLQKGLEAAKALDGGLAASGKPTAEQLANMSEDEFAEVMKKHGGLAKALA